MPLYNVGWNAKDNGLLLSPSPPPGFQPQQQIDLIDLTGVMVTTIELEIDIKLETEFAPKSNHFRR
jgi:hypothetical protein